MEGSVLNIGGISNSVVGLQITSMPGQQSEKSGEKPIVEKAVESNSRDVKERPFYEYQKEPWLTEPGYEHVRDRKEYVSCKRAEVVIDLALTRCSYNSFMRELSDSHPEIASKSFGFTLDADASIKIIDYTNSLTDDDKHVLIESMSNYGMFKRDLQSAAKGIMTLVDHDHETFGGRSRLDIENFQFVVDFGKVFNSPVEEMPNEWVRQIQENAETRDCSFISLDV